MDEITRRLMMGAAGAGEKIYIEDVFSTYLHTGNDSTQTITNGIDLSGKGGLAWIKCRTIGNSHSLFTTGVGSIGQYLNTNNASALQPNNGQMLQSFNASGFTLGSDSFVNASSGSGGGTYTSWTFRKAAKFFDVVTYVGDGNANLAVSHNLGSIPGAIIVKCTSTGSTSWKVYHRSLGRNTDLSLNTNEQAYTTSNFWGTSDPTSTQFYVGSAGATSLNGSGQTYVAYLFAHDAGGFGDTGNDSVVSCGSFTESGSGVSVNLGWEPQWLLVKKSDAAASWVIFDNMRGTPVDNYWSALFPNSSGAESGSYVIGSPTATGFKFAASGGGGWSNGTYIYIAIRRGPMKTPTDATKVFNTATGSYTSLATLTAADMVLFKGRNSYGQTEGQITDRLRGFLPFSSWTVGTTSSSPFLVPSSTAAESTSGSYTGTEPTGQNVFGNKNAPVSVVYGNPVDSNASGSNYTFRRAPGFFDVVAYTGTGAVRTVNHNLGVAPELMIVKRRSTSGTDWSTYVASLGNDKEVNLNLDLFSGSSGAWNNTTPTSSVFSLGSLSSVNANGSTYIAYLFATCPGVSKVGSYTGTGTTLQVNCGFTSGARFVMIKRTDSTGDWYVWDTARGIIAGNDPYLLLNSTAAEVTNTDYIDPYSAGFEISSTAPAAINANGGSFIYLAIA